MRLKLLKHHSLMLRSEQRERLEAWAASARLTQLILALRQEADHGVGEGVRLFDIGDMRGVENR
jgi:hypothetical protein